MDSKKVQFIRVNGDTLKTELTEDEKKFRKTQYPDDKSFLKVKEKVICTSCGKSLKEKVSSKDIRVHPVLDVLWCKKCEEFYSDGEFSADEDGSDKYCRWCAQGGSLYCCSYCSVAFCAKCVKRNCDKKVLKDIEDDEWKCFICVSRPLWPLRAICDAAKRYVDSGSKSRKTTRVSKAPSEDSTAESEVSSKRSKRKRKNDTESTEEEKYNADSEDTTSLETNRSKRKHVSSSDDNSNEKRSSSRRKKVDKEDAKPKPHADEPKKEKFEAIITDVINESAILRKLLSKKEAAWKKDYINSDVTALRETAQQAEEEFSKFFSDIVTSVNLIEKSFKDKWSVLESELKKSEENKDLKESEENKEAKESEENKEVAPVKETESTPDETEVGNKDVDMVDVSAEEPEIAAQEKPSPVPSPRKSSNVSVNGTNDVSSIFDDDNTTDANDKPADMEKSMKSISDSLAVNVSSIIDSLDSDEENELRNQNTSLPETDPLDVEQSKPSNGTEKDVPVVISDKDDDDEVTVTEPAEKVDSTLDEDKAKMSLLLSSSDAATTDNEKPKPSATDSELSGVSVLHSDQDDLQKTNGAEHLIHENQLLRAIEAT